MRRQYKMIRVPVEDYQRLVLIKNKMESDVHSLAGKRIPMTMVKTIRVLSNPEMRGYINVNMEHLINVAKEKRKR